MQKNGDYKKLVEDFNTDTKNVKVRLVFPDEDTAETAASLCIFIVGSLDTNNSHSFYRFACDLLKRLPLLDELRLDLQGVQYVSSAGIGTLISIMSFARQENVELVLCHVSPNIQNLIDILGFSSFFTICQG